MKYSDTSVSTLNGLKQDIYFKGKVNASTISDGDLNRIINKYYFMLQTAIRMVNENFYMYEATADLTISDGSYTFPDGTGTAPAYEKLKAIWAAFTPATLATPQPTEYVRVDAVDPDSIRDPSFTFSISRPKALMFGNYFTLLPLVTDATKYPVTDGVKIYYIAQPTALVNDTDVPNIFPDYHYAIVEGALIDIYERLEDDTNKEKKELRFKEILEEIKAEASNRFPEELGIIEGQDASGGWIYPWGQNSMA